MDINNGWIIQWFQGKPTKTLNITYAITLNQFIGFAISWKEASNVWDNYPNILEETSTGIKLYIDPNGTIQATWYYLLIFGY